MTCPECGSRKTKVTRFVYHPGGIAIYWRCKSCGATWQTG